MRVLNDHKYNTILQAAREEFVGHGFKETSMRGIAHRSGIGLSNIYNYFRNKDDIYRAVVGPGKSALFTFIAQQHTEETIEFHRHSPFGHDEKIIDQYINLIYKYKEEFRLLLYHSEGSSMEGFRDTFADYLTQVSLRYMLLEKKHYPETRDISPFFLHVMCSWTVSMLGEIVTHELSWRKIREFFEEYFRFSFAGWRELTGT